MAPSGIVTKVYKPISGRGRIILEVVDEKAYLCDINVSKKNYYRMEKACGNVIGQEVYFEGNKLIGVEIDDDNSITYLNHKAFLESPLRHQQNYKGLAQFELTLFVLR